MTSIRFFFSSGGGETILVDDAVADELDYSKDISVVDVNDTRHIVYVHNLNRVRIGEYVPLPV